MNSGQRICTFSLVSSTGDPRIWIADSLGASGTGDGVFDGSIRNLPVQYTTTGGCFAGAGFVVCVTPSALLLVFLGCAAAACVFAISSVSGDAAVVGAVPGFSG